MRAWPACSREASAGSVREYERGESLRKVHWPTTARRGQLMVKELEDSPRDEIAVVLDADDGALLALAAAIWHNWAIGAPDKRSLIAYDH